MDTHGHTVIDAIDHFTYASSTAVVSKYDDPDIAESGYLSMLFADEKCRYSEHQLRT